MSRPALGFTDSDLSIVSKITIAVNNSLNSLHYFQTCMKGPPGGKRRLCLQTTANNLQQRYIQYISPYLYIFYNQDLRVIPQYKTNRA
jgi:hypothetical protein